MLNLKSKNINKIIFLLICTVLVLTGVFITLKKYNKQEESYTLKLIEIIDRDEESRLTEDEIENYEVEINKELDTRLKDNKEMYKIKKTYYALGAIKYLQNEHSESIAYLNKALEYGVIDNEKKNIELDVRIYSALSSNHIIQQNIEESEIFFERAKTIALKNNEKHLLCELYYGKAKSIATSGYNINKPIDLMRKALEYTDTDSHKIRNYLYLSKLYKLSEEFELALEYTINALEIAMELKDNELIDKCVISLGEGYYVQGNYSKTIYIYESYFLDNKFEENSDKLTVYGYLAECYAKEGNYTNYKMYRDKCIELANKIDDVKSQVWIYSTSAGLELEFSNLDTAKVYLNKAQSMYDKSEEYIYSQNTDVVLNFAKSKIDYFEHKNYTETLSKYIDNLDVLDSRGVKSDIYSVITNEILNISLENDDLKTYKKYSVNINYDEKKLSQAYIDSMYTELNNNIKEKQLFKEKIKTHVLLILSIVSIYDLINNKKKNKKINKLNTKLREMNVLDPLTNLYNRGYLIETFGEIQNREDTITFIMIDIDYFKLYNDNYGHIKGDQVLIRVSEIIKSVFKDDMVFRYGGEEFSIISTKKLEDIIKYLDELKSKLHNENIIHEYSEVSDRVTLSIGLTSNKVCTENDAIQITKLADENLYKSKKKGRDRYTY